MEPNKKKSVKRMVSTENGKTEKVTDGRPSGKAKKLGGSAVFAPKAPPRLTSRKGGEVVKHSTQHVKLKR